METAAIEGYYQYLQLPFPDEKLREGEHTVYFVLKNLVFWARSEFSDST
jgi:hypothetical protein